MAKYSVNLNDIDSQLLKDAADEAGRSISAEIRMAVLAWLYTPEPEERDPEERKALLEEASALIESMVQKPMSEALLVKSTDTEAEEKTPEGV